MARYAASRRAGDFVFLSGVVAVDTGSGQAIVHYERVPEAARHELRSLGYDTGQLSVDVLEAPIVAQSWVVLDGIRALVREHGADLGDAVQLVQYFRDLRHFPAYSRVRSLFFKPVVSTVVGVARMLPGDAALIGVEAPLHLVPHAATARA